ncbi:MAG: hypothetical protein ACRDWD_17025 [Acidimicrobiia bacterium]
MVGTGGAAVAEAETRADRPRRGRTAPLIAALVLGLGLVAAPAVFQMFSRAPKGGDMLDGFRPYMTEAKVAEFQGYLGTIDEGAVETEDQVERDAEASVDLGAGGFADQYPLVAEFEDQWPAIDADMSDMLDTMERNLDNYAAVDALPPFDLFPWFFVLPGLIIAGLAAATLLARRRGRSSRTLVVLLGVMGLGLIAAPAVFQMFTRAPEGKEMIDDFRLLMTEEKVRTIQGYFLTIGSGEGQLRLNVLPDLETAGDETTYPAVGEFSEEWPTINNEFAPMIGAMSDNVENYEAVDALPPFTLFPWFFVVPGVLVIAFAFFAWPRRDPAHDLER